MSGLPCGSVGKESACNAAGPGSVSGWARSSGEGIGYPLQSSGLENSFHGRIVHGVTKSWAQLSDFHTHTYTHTHTQSDPNIGWSNLGSTDVEF